MKRIELAIESIILASRWLLVAFYLGLAAALAIYALSFAKKLFLFTTEVMTLNDTDTILRMLAVGATGVPRQGMGAIPAQLAATLPEGVVRLGARVTAVDGSGVTLDGGERVSGARRGRAGR